MLLVSKLFDSFFLSVLFCLRLYPAVIRASFGFVSCIIPGRAWRTIYRARDFKQDHQHARQNKDVLKAMLSQNRPCTLEFENKYFTIKIFLNSCFIPLWLFPNAFILHHISNIYSKYTFVCPTEYTENNFRVDLHRKIFSQVITVTIYFLS